MSCEIEAEPTTAAELETALAPSEDTELMNEWPDRFVKCCTLHSTPEQTTLEQTTPELWRSLGPLPLEVVPELLLDFALATLAAAAHLIMRCPLFPHVHDWRRDRGALLGFLD